MTTDNAAAAAAAAAEAAVEWAKYREILYVLLIVAGSATAISLLAALPGRFLGSRSYGKTLAVVIPFAWLGTVCGLIAGESQEPIVGALLTGMLTIVGALLSYSYSKDGAAGVRDILPFAIVSLCIGALVGIAMGHISKVKLDDYEKEYSIWKTRYEQVEIPLMKERVRHKTCRESLPAKDIAKCDEILVK